MFVKKKLTKQELKKIHASHGVGNGSAIRIYDVKTGTKVHIKQPNYYKHIRKHKNGKTTNTIFGAGDHPRLKHRVRGILHKSTA